MAQPELQRALCSPAGAGNLVRVQKIPPDISDTEMQVESALGNNRSHTAPDIKREYEEKKIENVKIFPIPSDSTDVWWDFVSPIMWSFFDRVRGRYNESHVVEALKKGDMQLWIIMQGHIILAACMTEIVDFPNLKECRIIQTTGEKYKEWIHLMPVLEEYAKSAGCSKIVGVARPGWEKILNKIGYEKTHVYLEKDL